MQNGSILECLSKDIQFHIREDDEYYTFKDYLLLVDYMYKLNYPIPEISQAIADKILKEGQENLGNPQTFQQLKTNEILRFFRGLFYLNSLD